MAWTTPRTWVANENPTAATINTHIGDNAEFLRDRMQAGNTSITPSGAGVVTTEAVTFSRPFASTPVVVVALSSGVPGSTVTGIGGHSETTTGFSISINRSNTTVTTVNWIAVVP